MTINCFEIGVELKVEPPIECGSWKMIIYERKSAQGLRVSLPPPKAENNNANLRIESNRFILKSVACFGIFFFRSLFFHRRTEMLNVGIILFRSERYSPAVMENRINHNLRTKNPSSCSKSE